MAVTLKTEKTSSRCAWASIPFGGMLSKAILKYILRTGSSMMEVLNAATERMSGTPFFRAVFPA